MAKGLFESENRSAPSVQIDEIPTGVTYTARFIVAGAVGYADGTYYLSQCALDSFADTLKGKPVLVGHQDVIDYDDMKKKAVGYVSCVRRDDEGGWYADFVIADKDAIEGINNGKVPYVSCAYRAELSEEDLTINNVKYKKRIVGGEMLHLALVKNPRYNGTEIWRNSAEDCFVSDGVLYNQKENVMNFFKKIKQEIDKDLLVNTADGEMTIEELINSLAALKEEIASKDAEIQDLKNQVEAQATKETEVPQTETQPTAVVEAADSAPAVETVPVENAADTDAEFKKDLNNDLQETISKVVVRVPDVSIK